MNKHSYYNEYLRRNNNRTFPGSAWDEDNKWQEGLEEELHNIQKNNNKTRTKSPFQKLTIMIQQDDEDEDEDENNTENQDDNISPLINPLLFPQSSNKNAYRNAHFQQQQQKQRRGYSDDDEYKRNKKSENFEVITSCNVTFADIGGYDNVKKELEQCIDILLNYTKYEGYNVRIPKGLILEGPPGNGKTLLAKGFAGETKTSFIPVSGAQFQDKYVGVGSSRVRELFDLAKKNTPCVVFIDEIDALGRKRSGDGEASSSERDNTLNELLIALDGFHTTTGIFLIGATNRADLLDPALLRPGRIDKRIFIGLPDVKTRRAILSIHLRGKPYNESTIILEDLVDMTVGLSGAQIENLLNEAMLIALRNNRVLIQLCDLDTVMNKMLMGWQPNEHQFTEDIIDRIAIHEMGHAVVGLMSKNHAKVTKVSINLFSPTTPGFTLFEGTTSAIYTKESLFEHLMILLAGRIAEEEFYDVSTTTGATMDFEEAFKLAERMVLYYGMGRKSVIYPSHSDRYKEMIDDEVLHIINSAYEMSKTVIQKNRDFVKRGAEALKKERVLKAPRLEKLLEENKPPFFEYPVIP